MVMLASSLFFPSSFQSTLNTQLLQTWLVSGYLYLYLCILWERKQFRKSNKHVLMVFFVIKIQINSWQKVNLYCQVEKHDNLSKIYLHSIFLKQYWSLSLSLYIYIYIYIHTCVSSMFMLLSLWIYIPKYCQNYRGNIIVKKVILNIDILCIYLNLCLYKISVFIFVSLN